MKVYDTKYSKLENIPKKERKIIESNYPYVILNQDFNSIDFCGQKFDKESNGIKQLTKFCPICDHPMIVKMSYSPCDHITCYKCSQPNFNTCKVCDEEILYIKRLPDNIKLFECDFYDCFRFFDNIEKLKIHKQNMHSI